MTTTYRKSWPETLFQLLNFTFDPSFNVKWGYLTTKALYLLEFSIITDPKAGDNCCGSGVVATKYPLGMIKAVFITPSIAKLFKTGHPIRIMKIIKIYI